MSKELTTGAVPIAEISALLNEAMTRASENGADSRSMPDEYVAIAHFTCYPEKYGYAAPPVPSAPAVDALTIGAVVVGYYWIGEDNRQKFCGSFDTIDAETAKKAQLVYTLPAPSPKSPAPSVEQPMYDLFADGDLHNHKRQGGLSVDQVMKIAARHFRIYSADDPMRLAFRYALEAAHAG